MPTTKVLADYLAALAGTDQVPELPGAQGRIDPVLAPLAPVRGLVVASPPGSGAGAVADALAVRLHGRREPLLDRDPYVTLGSGEPNRHVLVVALEEEVGIELVVALIDRLAQVPGQPGLGFLTAGDLPDLSRLVAKSLTLEFRPPPSREHVSIAPQGPPPRLEGLDSTVLAGANVNRSRVLDLLHGGRTRVLSVMSSGREHLALLNDTVLCGSDDEQRARWRISGVDRLGPHCTSSDECLIAGVKVADVVEARSVDADFVLSYSCLSWRPAGVGATPTEFQLTGAFGRGAAACVVGGVFPSHAAPWVLEHFHRRLAAGAAVGQVVNELNARARQQLDELPYFVIQGFPWASTRPRGRADPVNVPQSPARRVTPSAPTELSRPWSVADAIAALRSLEVMGVRGRSVVEAVAALEACASGNGTEVLDRLVAAERAAAEELVDYFSSTFAGFDGIWEPHLETTVLKSGQPCWYCGGSVAEMQGREAPAQHGISRTGRTSGLCHSCGPVWDVPLGALQSTPRLTTATRWPQGSVQRVEVEVSPGSSGWSTDVVVVAGYLHGLYFSGVDVAPPAAVAVPRGGREPLRCTLAFAVGSSAFVHHQHFLRVLTIVGGEVVIGGRGVAIEPAAASQT